MHSRHGGIYSGLRIESIKDCLYKQCIHTTLYQSIDLFQISIIKTIISNITGSRIAHIRTHGTCFVGRSYGTCYESRPLRCRIGIGYTTRNPRPLQSHIPTIRLHMIIRFGYALAVECVGGNYISTYSKIFTMYVFDNIGTRNV